MHDGGMGSLLENFVKKKLFQGKNTFRNFKKKFGVWERSCDFYNASIIVIICIFFLHFGNFKRVSCAISCVECDELVLLLF